MREKLISIFCCPLGVQVNFIWASGLSPTSLRKGFHLSSLRGECRFPLKEKKKNIKRRRLSPSPSFGLHNWPCEIALYLQRQIMRSLFIPKGQHFSPLSVSRAFGATQTLRGGRPENTNYWLFFFKTRPLGAMQTLLSWPFGIKRRVFSSR